MKKYDHQIQNGKSNKGGVFNEGTTSDADKGIDTNFVSSLRYEQLEGRELFPKATTSDVGKDSNSPRKNSTSIRTRLFRRRRNTK
jgi:hypothetical protein